MESRMRRSGNAAMACLWPAQCLVGGKGKRYPERHQEGRIHFIHHGTLTHSQHERILGRGFRARQGIINEWLRRNLNRRKARTRMCCPVQARGLHRQNDYVPFWHISDFRPLGPMSKIAYAWVESIGGRISSAAARVYRSYRRRHVCLAADRKDAAAAQLEAGWHLGRRRLPP